MDRAEVGQKLLEDAVDILLRSDLTNEENVKRLEFIYKLIQDLQRE